MKALNRKLWRDMWRMKAQVFAIIIVVMCGIITYIMFISNMDSLNYTRNKFYSEFAFADIFAPLKRAPDAVKEQINQIPGVALVETRICADVKLDIEDFPEPVMAKIVSLPDDGKPLLNKLYLKKGRIVDPSADGEVVISDTFADAHKFSLGGRFGAVINGKWKILTIVGVALTPEFILQLRPGAMMPDYKRYGILWMSRSVLATAYNMKGAFNDVIITTSPNADVNDIINRLDKILDRYGGFGSYARKDQLSHRFLNEEFRQLDRSAKIFPTIFIFVAAFLLNVVIGRTINTQRDQIAILKAFGYSNLQIGLHYFQFVFLIIIIGVTVGTAAGAWLGRFLGNIYMEFYRFPYLIYRLNIGVVLMAVIISLTAALLGTLHSLWSAARLAPAAAMYPENPPKYSKSFIERLVTGRWLTQPSRIIVRNIERKPIRSLLSVIGIALSCAIMITGGFFKDAVDYMVNVQFALSQKEDLKVSFIEPTSRKALYELKGLRGVEYVEGFRSVPVKLIFGHRSYKTAIDGVDPTNRLNYLLDTNLKPLSIPPSGLVLTDYLGKMLGIKPGDTVTLEVLEGSRPTRQVPVAAFVKQYLGVMGYMDLAALNRLMREGNEVSGANLVIDRLYKKDIYNNLIYMPRVSGMVVRKDEIQNFYKTQAKAMLFFTFVATLMASVITLGVVYNCVRIALSERRRELSSLRVLGYTRGEISYILLGELGILTLSAIPIGFIIGWALCIYIARSLSSDIFRVPEIIEAASYSLAAAVVLLSASVSGLIVRHRLDHLNLVEVLKARE